MDRESADSHVDDLARRARLSLWLTLVPCGIGTLLIAAAVATRAPLELLALLPIGIALLEPLLVWRARPYRHRVWLREPESLDAALAFCAPMGRRCHPITVADEQVAFTFMRERDAVAFKLGWG